MGEDIFGWSTDGELFRGEATSREEALAEAKREYPNAKHLWTAAQRPLDIRILASGFAERVMESITDNIADEVGDLADGLFESVTEEQETELDEALAAVISDWVERHGLQPQFYGVSDVEEHRVYAINVGDVVTCEALVDREAVVIETHVWSDGRRTLQLRIPESGFVFGEWDSKCVLIRTAAQVEEEANALRPVGMTIEPQGDGTAMASITFDRGAQDGASFGSNPALVAAREFAAHAVVKPADGLPDGATKGDES